MVTCDPPGAKIGNGKARMHILEWLRDQLPKDDMVKFIIIVIINIVVIDMLLLYYYYCH